MLRRSRHHYQRLETHFSNKCPEFQSEPAYDACPKEDGPEDGPAATSMAASTVDTAATEAGSGRSSGAGDDGDQCVICFDHEADAVLVECGHGGLCADCAVLCWDALASGRRKCPLCRCGFAGVMRIRRHHGDLVL